MFEKLDEFATEIFDDNAIKRFPYKTVSETMILSCLTCLRDVLSSFDLLSPNRELSREFANEVQILSFIFLIHRLTINGVQIQERGGTIGVCRSEVASGREGRDDNVGGIALDFLASRFLGIPSTFMKTFKLWNCQTDVAITYNNAEI